MNGVIRYMTESDRRAVLEIVQNRAAKENYWTIAQACDRVYDSGFGCNLLTVRGYMMEWCRNFPTTMADKLSASLA